MKITRSKNKSTYNIEVDQYELNALYSLAIKIGGSPYTTARRVFSNTPESLHEQSLKYATWLFSFEFGPRGSIYFDDDHRGTAVRYLKRDKNGRFAK